jgi:uncharacterized protein (DUF111 family)
MHINGEHDVNKKNRNINVKNINDRNINVRNVNVRNVNVKNLNQRRIKKIVKNLNKSDDYLQGQQLSLKKIKLLLFYCHHNIKLKIKSIFDDFVFE